MKWLMCAKAAKALHSAHPGITTDALQKRAKRGTWLRVRGADGWFYYAVPETGDDMDNPRVPDPEELGYELGDPEYDTAIEEAFSQEDSRDPDSYTLLSGESDSDRVKVTAHHELNPDKDYKYWSEVDEENDVVVAFMPMLKRPLRVPKDIDAQIHRAYSYDGSGMRIREIANQLRWRPFVMQGYLRARGLTHASHIWPDWEIDQKNIDDLVEDALVAKAEKAKARAERLEVERIKRDSEIGRNFRSLADHLSQAFSDIPPIQVHDLPDIPDSGFDAYFPMKDLHIGKLPHNAGVRYTLEEQEHRVRESIDITIQKVISRWGVPACWRLGTGDDQLNSNSSKQETLRGTPQGEKSVGSFHHQAETLMRIKAYQIEACLRAGGRVYDHYIPSNHAPDAEFLIAHYLAAHFKDEPRVTVNTNPSVFKTFVSGITPVLDLHGHGTHDKDLPAIAARYCPGHADFSKAVVFRGHTHAQNKYVTTYREETESGGVEIYVVPTCGPACSYEELHGWHLTRPRQTVYRIDHCGGVDGWLRA